MKKSVLFLVCMACISVTMAQLKGQTNCPDLTVDILTGRVNGVKPDVPLVEMKSIFACYKFTAVEESDSAKCGGGLFAKDRDIYFYTRRDYIEVGDKFKGKFPYPIFGTARGAMFSKFGNPKVKDTHWDAYQTQYGTLVVYYNAANKANKIQFSTLGTERLNLCE